MINPNMFKILILLLSSCLLSCESDSVIENTEVSITKKSIPKETYISKSGEVKKGQGFYHALKDVGINNAQALDIINSLQDEVEFSKLKVGDKLEAIFNQDNKLLSFSFSQNPAEKHLLNYNFTHSNWDYKFKEEPTFWQSRILEGELKKDSTLQDDLIASGLSRPVVAEIVNILLCKVNFRYNARMGDKFKVLLNERKYQGRTLQTKILYTYYSGVRAGTSEAFYYEDETKASTYTAHYTADGQPLIRSGLRYPLSRLHIRSSYGKRIHPVTGRRVMHRGVDLRGRVGEKVHAVASGKVVISTYNKYAGNKVGIKHSDGSISYYFHLHKKYVKKGQWVKSYQVIGSVGATGRVTGPHLHFGFKKKNGRWMNPMNKRMIATPKLSGEKFAKLQEQINNSQKLLDQLELSKVAHYIVEEHPNRIENLFLHALNEKPEELFYTTNIQGLETI